MLHDECSKVEWKKGQIIVQVYQNTQNDIRILVTQYRLENKQLWENKRAEKLVQQNLIVHSIINGTTFNFYHSRLT